MPDAHADLLRRARDEVYHCRVLVRGLRNRTKVDSAALFDSEQRLEDLSRELELALTDPHAKEAQGHEGRNEVASPASR